jgi:predicted aspartyl protease
MLEPRTGQTGYSIAVLFNGSKKLRLQLDTGAHGILIHAKAAERMKLETVSPSHIRGIGDLGQQQGNIVMAQSVAIGPLDFHNCPLHVTGKKLMPDVDGIIGINVFQQFLITLNLPKNIMEINPLPSISGVSTDPESWKNLDRTIPPELQSFALIGSWGNLAIPTLVNKKKSAYFFLDTGASVNVVSREMASQVSELRDVGKVLGGLSGTTNTYVAQNVSLQIGHLYQANDSIYAIDLKDMNHKLGLEISGLLGHPMLSNLVITVDLRDGLIDFQYPFAHKDKGN